MIELLKEREKQKQTLQKLVCLYTERYNGVDNDNNGVIKKIHDYVIEKIRTGKWHSGDRIIESSLAKQFKVSHVPVRETMEKLQQENWVERIPNKGICVRVFDADAIKHVFQVREMLESEAARALAGIITDEQLDELEKLIGLIESGKKTDNTSVIQDADAHFHRLIVHFLGNPVLEKMFETLLLQTHGTYYTVTYSLPFYTKQVKQRLGVAGHQQILQALKKRKALEAEELIRKHIKIGAACAIRVCDMWNGAMDDFDNVIDN